MRIDGRISILITMLGILLLASGCGHEHTWVEATCDMPRMCSECGETEGGPLGHDFAPADCETPETCIRCGQTRGPATGHDTEGSPANYQEPATCSVCGKPSGEPLTPDFETYNLTDRMIEMGEILPYVTTCYQDPSRITTGSAAVIGYEIFGSDEAHEPIEGYSWRKVIWELTFSDENANAYGFSVATCSEDYYNIKQRDDSSLPLDGGDGSERMFTCTWYGVQYDQCIVENSAWSWGEWSDDGSITGTMTSYYLLPDGYDGAVAGLLNSGTEWPDDAYIYDIADADTIFFRLE